MIAQPQYVTDTDGNKVSVILSMEAYDRLLDLAEDMQDIIDADKAMKEIENGEDELIPSDVVDRLLSGEFRIKVWREYREISQVDLAKQSGITKSYLSQIESGKKSGSIEVLKQIASALSVDLDDIV